MVFFWISDRSMHSVLENIWKKKFSTEMKVRNSQVLILRPRWQGQCPLSKALVTKWEWFLWKILVMLHSLCHVCFFMVLSFNAVKCEISEAQRDSNMSLSLWGKKRWGVICVTLHLSQILRNRWDRKEIKSHRILCHRSIHGLIWSLRSDV